MAVKSLSVIPAIVTEWRRVGKALLFDRRFYAAQDGVGWLARRFPLLHYLVRGEKCGLKPNLWFDPVFYRRQIGENWTGRSAIGHYIAAGADRMLQPSPLVDVEWYRFQNPDARTASSVLSHILRFGIPQRRDPSPLIDLVAIQQLATEQNQPFETVLRQVVDGKLRCNACYQSLDEIAAAQRQFRDRIAVRTLQERMGAPRRNLLFVQAGRRMSALEPPPDRTWDLCLNWYDDGWREYSGRTEMQFQQPGTKFTGIAKIHALHPEVLDRYERIWLLDDDIEIEPAAIDCVFRTAESCCLDLAQPSLTADSACVWTVFFHQPAGPAIRYTNGVEIMMPVISSRLLRLAGSVLSETVSGFGLDFLLAMLAGNGRRKNVAVVNDCVVRHPVPIDPASGTYYEYLRHNNINPKAELFRIIRKYRTGTAFYELPP